MKSTNGGGYEIPDGEILTVPTSNNDKLYVQPSPPNDNSDFTKDYEFASGDINVPAPPPPLSPDEKGDLDCKDASRGSGNSQDDVDSNSRANMVPLSMENLAFVRAKEDGKVNNKQGNELNLGSRNSKDDQISASGSGKANMTALFMENFAFSMSDGNDKQDKDQMQKSNVSANNGEKNNITDENGLIKPGTANLSPLCMMNCAFTDA